MSSFDSLTLALEGWFDKALCDLPDALRQRVEEEFFPMPWDRLSAEERRRVALQLDYPDDPATEQERQFCSDFADSMLTIETKIAKWEAIPTLTASDLALQESQLAKLRPELAGMWTQVRQAQGDNCPVRTLIESKDAKAPVGTSKGDPVGNCAAFHAMENLVASELSLAFVGDKSESGIGANNLLEISARNTTKRVALVELDLVNRRLGTLNSQGVILLGLALKNKLKRNEKNAKTMTRLREVLYLHLGVTGDPFEPHHKSVGWVPHFKISDNRGKADERARQDAERRTVSYDQLTEFGERFTEADRTHSTFDEENDPADEWLKENDPDASA